MQRNRTDIKECCDMRVLLAVTMAYQTKETAHKQKLDHEFILWQRLWLPHTVRV